MPGSVVILLESPTLTERTESLAKIATARAAEENAAVRMRQLGFGDASVTNGGPDGGVDVRSSTAIAQVKCWFRPVGTPDLQRLFGARGHQQHLKMLFFARSGYARGAISYATDHEIALFTFDDEGHFSPVNDHARTLISHRSTARSTERSLPSSPKVSSARNAELSSYYAEREASLARQEHYFEVGCQIAELRMRKLGFSSGNMHTGNKAGEYTVLFVDRALAGIRVTRGVVGHFTLIDLMKVAPDRYAQRFYFSCDGYSQDAIDYADSYGIALFTYGRAQTTFPTNGHAHALVRRAR